MMKIGSGAVKLRLMMLLPRPGSTEILMLNPFSLVPTAYRVNAEVQLKAAVDQGATLFSEIHEGRKIAFSRYGAGYADYNNYRWQAGKASGAIQAAKILHDYQDAVNKSAEAQTYGLELPDTRTLVRRAATYRSAR